MKTSLTSAKAICRIAIALLPMFGALKSRSQDTLFMKNSSIISGLVTEVGLDEIKYIDPATETRVTVVVEKSRVVRIRYANGRDEIISHDPMETRMSDRVLAKQQAVKIAFLSPVFGHLTFAYERVVGPWMNFEAKAGIIGVGEAGENVRGFLTQAGVKMVARPTTTVRGMKQNHPLQGKYLKPEILFSSYSSMITEPIYTNSSWGYPMQTGSRITKVNFTNVAFNLVLGKQMI